MIGDRDRAGIPAAQDAACLCRCNRILERKRGVRPADAPPVGQVEEKAGIMLAVARVKALEHALGRRMEELPEQGGEQQKGRGEQVDNRAEQLFRPGERSRPRENAYRSAAFRVDLVSV